MNLFAPTDTESRGGIDRYLPAGQGGYPQQIGLADVRAMLWRQRKWLGAILGAVLLLGIAVTLLMTPLFQADATVRIDNESVKIVEGQDLDPVIGINDTSRYLTTQQQIVESRSLAATVVDALKLDRDGSFAERMGAKVEGGDLPEKRRQAARREQAIKLLRKNVSMAVKPDSRVATISFVSRDPVLAAQVANSFADNFIAQNVRQRYDTNAYARRVLNEQVALAQAQLQQTEREAIDYARRNRLIDTGDASSGADDGGAGDSGNGGARSITTANLVQLNAAYIDARAARIAAEQRWRAAQASAGTDLPEARQNQAMQTLLSERARVAAKLAELRQRYLSGQPEVQEAAAQLSALEGQIAAIGRTLKNSIRNEYDSALRQERQLAAAKEGMADETLTEQQRRVQLNLVARDADTQRKQLNDLLTRLNQINAAADITLNNMSLLDAAQVPEDAVSPQIRKNMLIALALGLILAFGVAFTREALDDTLRSPEDAERKLHLPLLGTTPYVSDLSNDDPQGELNEAYYSIRATVDYASATVGSKVFLVTSSQPGEGKSTTAVAIARDFARIGRRVLLVDADLRNPSLHRTLNLAREHGLIDVLMKHKAFDDVVVTQEIANLHLLPLGPIPPNPVQILSTDLIGDFVTSMRDRYDVVILDSAPVMGLADAPMLSRAVDHVVLIVEANRAHYGQAKAAVRRLRDAGANLLGIVMSKFSFRDAGYSYDYHYSYYSYRDKQAEPGPAS